MNRPIKLLCTGMITLGLLSGCGEEEKPMAKIENVKVIDKSTKGHYRASDDYFLKVEKNGNIAIFEVSEETFNAVTNGTVISGNQYRTNQLKDITFPNLK